MMRFKRSSRSAGARRFSGRGRRPTPYEIAQLSICRVGLATGLSSCGVPDQFFQCLVNGRDWKTPLILGTGLPVDVNIIPDHEGKGITVRGVQFDYQYSCVPDAEETEGQSAAGITSIRSALVVMRLAAPGSAGQNEPPLPDTPLFNILFHNDTMKWQGQSTNFTNFELSKSYRILWRGMEMMGNIVMGSNSNAQTAAGFQTPMWQTQSRHVRLRTGCRLGNDEGLFFVTEIVNPFLEVNPTFGLDLFGTAAIKSSFRGNRYDT